MSKTFHFISGLPRSGSTLLAAILRQNPQIQAGMTSPVGSMFQTMMAQVSADTEFGPSISIDQRKRLLRGLFDNFYADCDKNIIIDTSRIWTSQLPALLNLFPESKVLCTVREVSWIMDSMERQYRENVFENTRLFSTPDERATVYSRVDTLANRNRLVGFAYSALREACYSDLADKLLLIDYDILCAAPKRVINLVYEFLDEPKFDHDFENIDYDAERFDARLGLTGLHKIRPKVGKINRRTILPPDLFKTHGDQEFWRDLEGSQARVIIMKPDNTSGNTDGIHT